MLEHISVGQVLAQPKITAECTRKPLTESDRMKIQAAADMSLGEEVVLIVSWALTSVFFYALRDPHDGTFFDSPNNLVPLAWFYLVLLAPIPFLLWRCLHLRQQKRQAALRRDEELRVGEKEVYRLKAIESRFYSSQDNAGSYYLVKFEGLALEAIVHESQLPQVVGTFYELERLPSSQRVLGITNTHATV
jgi:hypothetical protein